MTRKSLGYRLRLFFEPVIRIQPSFVRCLPTVINFLVFFYLRIYAILIVYLLDSSYAEFEMTEVPQPRHYSGKEERDSRSC